MIITDRITSFQNARVKLARQLQEKKARHSEKRFVIDYGRDLERALLHGYQVDYVLATPQMLSADDQRLLTMHQVTVYEVAPDILDKASYRQNASGLVAVMHQNTLLSTSLLPQRANLILVLVGLEKPGNIGALLRTADATGVGAVLLVDISMDRYNPNIIRASTGACFLPTIAEMNTQDALSFCQTYDYNIVAAHLDGISSLYNVDFKTRTAIVLGAEDKGLTDVWRDACHQLMKIPMVGTLTDSLNVSVAGAVILYEALRQRTTHTYEN